MTPNLRLAQLMSSATGGPRLLLHSLQGEQNLVCLIRMLTMLTCTESAASSVKEVCSLQPCIVHCMPVHMQLRLRIHQPEDDLCMQM